MKFEAITIKDIARHLGVSKSTVSRALQDHYAVNSETKKRIVDYAEKVKYRPNPAALGLREKRTLSIGIVVCEIANSFFSEVINGVESLASERGYNIVISQTHESSGREHNILNFLSSRSIDGILISASAETSDFAPIKKLHQMGLPMVFFDRVTPDIDTHTVVVNNFEGAYKATEHLIKNGYKNIAAIAGAETMSITQERLAGYKAALLAHNIPVDPSYIKHCYYAGMRLNELIKPIDELMSLAVTPDAIFATSDKLTTGSLEELTARKIEVPKQMALVGFSNSEVAHLLNPGVTTVKQPAFEMGQAAAELLLKLITSKRAVTEFERQIFSPQLTVRESSAPKENNERK
jgi:LacI family transcriptional regulator